MKPQQTSETETVSDHIVSHRIVANLQMLHTVAGFKHTANRHQQTTDKGGRLCCLSSLCSSLCSFWNTAGCLFHFLTVLSDTATSNHYQATGSTFPFSFSSHVLLCLFKLLIRLISLHIQLSIIQFSRLSRSKSHWVSWMLSAWWFR